MMPTASTNNPQNRINRATIRCIHHTMRVDALGHDAFITLLPLFTSAPMFRILRPR